jgi:hypothetical protein
MNRHYSFQKGPRCSATSALGSRIQTVTQDIADTSSGQERRIKAVFNVTAMERSILVEVQKKRRRSAGPTSTIP